MENVPKIVKHLLSIGFVQIKGEWRDIWGQGDGEYWYGELRRGNDVVYTDQEKTLYKYSFNGVIMSDEFFMKLI